MVTKTLLILANSIKNHERCIAGREVVWNPRGYVFGSWIRPVSGHGEGELGPTETVRPDRSRVNVMEFADVRLSRHLRDPGHPEDWLIDGQMNWDKPRRSCKPPPLTALAQAPAGLWLERNVLSDRISHAALIGNPPAASICIIRPDNLQLVFWTEHHPVEARLQRKFRGRFEYNKVLYDLSLTDPVATDRLCNPMPAVHEGKKTATLESESGPLICVSLTPEFKQTGHHFKVIATILGV